MISRAPWMCRGLAIACLGFSLLSATAAPLPESPRALFKDLFDAVQQSQVFADSKTFADAVPKLPPPQILALFHAAKPESREALRAFVAEYFTLPEQVVGPAQPAERVAIAQHIDSLWDQLTRSQHRRRQGIPRCCRCRNPTWFPAGAFANCTTGTPTSRCWDLAQSGRHDLVERHGARFCLPDRHLWSRAERHAQLLLEPLAAAVLLRDGGITRAEDPAAAYARYLPQLRREYAFWMQGEAGLKRGTAHRRVVAMPDGAVLNRYWDDPDTPREESYREDTELARAAGVFRSSCIATCARRRKAAGTSARAGLPTAGPSRPSIPREIVPVDLNSLLFGLENAIRAGCERAG